MVAVSRSKENLDEHVAPLAKQGLAVVPVSADASTDDGIATVMDQVRELDGDLYGLVNIAGGAAPSTWMPSTRVTRDDWRALFTANLETAFFMSQAVAAEIRDAGQPGLDRVDLVDQRDEHRAVPHRVRHRQGGGGGDDPDDGGRTRTRQHPGQRRGARRDRDCGVAHLRRRGPGARPQRDRDGPPWHDPRNRQARSCSYCRTCRATSPARPCSSTVDSTSNGPISAPTTPRCSSRTNPSEQPSVGSRRRR